MKTFDINEELERVEGRLAESIENHIAIPIYGGDSTGEKEDAAFAEVCEEVSAEIKGDLLDMTFRNWNAACKAVQARRAAA